MKKTYICPRISVVEAETVLPLAGSITGDDPETTHDFENSPGGGGDANNPNDFTQQSKEHNFFWDDWEE